MLERRFSEMTLDELRNEIAQLTEKAQKAQQMGMVNEYAVYERKIQMAKAYMMDPDQFSAGEIYEIDGDPGTYFKIDYMNGVFAWGYRVNGQGQPVQEGEDQEEALPISLLGKKIESN
ncbi:MAG: YfhH family protein [Bacillaceae bacterium]|nr:YfhH family protein [Bacillaceae bacterium]